MPLLNRFLPYSISWHVAVNSYKKHSMHCIGMHDVAVHDVAVLDVTMHDVTVHDVAMHDIAVQRSGVYCVSMHGMDVPGGKKKTI
jgi:hypothetical protein